MPRQRVGRRARTRQSGAAAVEFGLIVLPLVLLLFGIIQYGFYFWSMQAGSAATRDAARQAAVGNLNCTELRGYVEARIGPARNASKPITVRRTFGTVDVSNGDFNPGPATIGETVRVQVIFNSFDITSGLIPLPDDALVEQVADARVENVEPGSGGETSC